MSDKEKDLHLNEDIFNNKDKDLKKYIEVEEEFETDFLSDRFKEADKKVESGEISCNLDNPEDCENCGS